MLSSENETIALSSVIQSLDGHSSDVLTNVCGKHVADIISSDQKMNKKVLEGHSVEEFKFILGRFAFCVFINAVLESIFS